MRESVTVQQAISKGKMKLVYLPIILIFLSIGIGLYLLNLQVIDGWLVAGICVVGILLAWLSWSYFVVEWKVWAFENVRNVHELKRKAIQNNLIWKDDSWFNKTEIINYEQKQKLKYLEKKFVEKDIYNDDSAVPKETIIKFSKGGIAFGLLFGTAAIAFPIYLFLDGERNYFYLIFIIVGGLLIYNSVKRIKAKEPSIIINSLGIKLAEIEFMSWKSISNDMVEQRNSGKNTNYYLNFMYRGENFDVDLGDLDTTPEKLEKLLHVYRVRYDKNNLN